MKKPIIGILGGVYSGKSTVAAEFAKHGCKVINADAIAHKLLAKDSVKKEVMDSFGSQILDSKGNVDRSALARIAFSDKNAIERLNRILHPKVLEHVEELIKRFQSNPVVRAVILDMPLLLEVGWVERCDKLIFVACDDTERHKRAKEQGLLSENEIKVRENFQISLDKKESIADNTVNNNSDFSALAKQVSDIFSDIMGSY